MRSYFIVCSLLIVVGCSDQQNLDNSESSINNQNQTEITSSRIMQEVPRISDIKDDKAIVKAAGVPPVKITDSTDSNGAIKKIYKFAQFGAQVELSPKEIIIAWVKADDTESAKLKSQESFKVAQRLAIATLGSDAGEVVQRLNSTEKSEDLTIEGYRVTSTGCIGGICLMKIYR